MHSSSNSILITNCCAMTWAWKHVQAQFSCPFIYLILKSQSLKFCRRRGGLGAKLSGFKFAIARVGFTGASSISEQKWGVRIKIGHWTLGLWPQATAPTSNPYAPTFLCISIPQLAATIRQWHMHSIHVHIFSLKKDLTGSLLCFLWCSIAGYSPIITMGLFQFSPSLDWVRSD